MQIQLFVFGGRFMSHKHTFIEIVIYRTTLLNTTAARDDPDYGRHRYANVPLATVKNKSRNVFADKLHLIHQKR